MRRESIERKLDAVRPVSLLMGCSSAALKDLGKYEPCGIVQSYLQARCPAVAGNLFDVTDADIDRFFIIIIIILFLEHSNRLVFSSDSCLRSWKTGSQNAVEA